jgi:hypothetical protein
MRPPRSAHCRPSAEEEAEARGLRGAAAALGKATERLGGPLLPVAYLTAPPLTTFGKSLWQGV